MTESQTEGKKEIKIGDKVQINQDICKYLLGVSYSVNGVIEDKYHNQYKVKTSSGIYN